MPTTIDHWVPILEASLPEDQNGILVRLSADGELGLLPLDGAHPLELLDGVVLSDEWDAVGLVAHGWASPMGGERPSRHPARRRVCSTVLVDRAGRTAGRVVAEDGTVVCDRPPPEGAVLDALRRALGR